MERITISIPASTLWEIDKIIEVNPIFRNRSQLIQFALYTYVAETYPEFSGKYFVDDTADE